MRRLGGMLAALILLSASLAGCLSEDLGTSSVGTDGDDATTAAGIPDDDAVLTGNESVEQEDGQDQQTPPFYARTIVTVTGRVAVTELATRLSTVDGDIDVRTAGPSADAGNAWELVVVLEGRGTSPELATQQRERLSFAWDLGTPDDPFVDAKVEKGDAVPVLPEQIGLNPPGFAEGNLTLVLPHDQFVELAANSTDGDVSVHDLAASSVDVDVRDGDVSVHDTAAEGVSITTRDGDVDLSDLDASSVSSTTRDGDVEVSDASVSSLAVTTRDGDVDASDLSASSFTAEARDGDLGVEVSGTASVSLTTRDGDVDAEVTPGDHGGLTVTTRDGSTDLELPEDDAHGYDLTATAEDGSVDIQLEDGNARVDETDDGTRGVFRTDGFEDRSVRTDVGIDARDGDVLVGPS